MGQLTEIGRLALTFVNLEFYWSAILLGQYLLETSTDFELFIITKSLYHLKFYKKLQKIIEKHPYLLKYKEIKLIYIKAGFEADSAATLSFELQDPLPICYSSVELFFCGLSKREMLRKDLFIKSFECDKNNIEPLLFLFKESLCNTDEILFLINQIANESLRQIMIQLINYTNVDDDFLSPLFLFSSSSNMFFSMRSKEIKLHFNNVFRSTSKNLTFFNDSELLYHSLGMYYLLHNRNKEALKSFYKAIELNKNFGQGYLLAGIAHSRMRETETAVSILNHANYILMTSFIPSYCLACEYQVMNNINVAKYHYKVALKSFEKFNFVNEKLISNGKTENNLKLRTLNSYIYCLIYNEEYEEALKCLESNNITNVLKVFCYLFVGNLSEAKASLALCELDARYYACKGFILHLIEDYFVAIDSYEKSLDIKRNKIVEKLMLMAQENSAHSKENKSYDYTNCLFESLGFNDAIF